MKEYEKIRREIEEIDRKAYRILPQKRGGCVWVS